jgi:hypothetical protein
MLAVPGNDAAGFLSAMLKGMETESGEGSRFGSAEDAEHPALLVQMIVVVLMGMVQRFVLFRHNDTLPSVADLGDMNENATACSR